MDESESIANSKLQPCCWQDLCFAGTTRRAPAGKDCVPRHPWCLAKLLQPCCWVQNLMIDLPNFAENASFVSLLKLSQTNKDMRERLLPILKAKRLQELKSLQTWFSTLNRNYTLEELINLKELDLAGKQITKIPPEIGQLINLNYLDLNRNQITIIPSEIGLLTQQHSCNLVYLRLNDNYISVIPPEIGLLINLRDLWLNHNHITKIPPEIGQLTNLKRLYLDHNHINEIPPDLFGEVSKAKYNGMVWYRKARTHVGFRKVNLIFN